MEIRFIYEIRILLLLFLNQMNFMSHALKSLDKLMPSSLEQVDFSALTKWFQGRVIFSSSMVLIFYCESIFYFVFILVKNEE